MKKGPVIVDDIPYDDLDWVVFQRGCIRVELLHGHHQYPNQWAFKCEALFSGWRPMEEDSIEAAKKTALNHCREKLKRMTHDLYSLIGE